MKSALHFRIYGQVQGVGFRFSMQRKATALGLCGWVRNRSDGSVEAVACGDAAALALLREWAAHGPRSARVEKVEIAPWPETLDGQDFAQIATL